MAAAASLGSWEGVAADLARYQELAVKVQQLDKDKPVEHLGQARHAAQRLTQELVQVRAPLASLEAELVQEKAELDGMYYPGKFILNKPLPIPVIGDMAKSKLEEREAAVEKLRSEAKGQARLIHKTEHKLAKAKKEAEGWQGKAVALRGCREEAERVLARILAAPQWAECEAVQALQAEHAALLLQAKQVEKDGGAVEEVVDKLNNAALKLMRARFDLRPHEQVERTEVIKDAKKSSVLHTVTLYESGAGLAAEVAAEVVKGGNALVQSAVADVREALAALPELPGLEAALLDSAAAGLFDGMLPGDTKGKVKASALQGGLEAVGRLEAGAKQALGWAKGRAVELEEEAQRLRKVAAGKDTEVKEFKKAQVALALERSAALN